MLRRNLLLFLTLLTGFILAGKPFVLAQEFTPIEITEEADTSGILPTETAEATPIDAPVSTGVDASTLENATQSYYSAVEAYRDADERFVLAQSDYYQQNTLASLEEALRRSKDLMRARGTVLETYFTYLQLTLQDTRGLESTDKDAVISQLNFWRNQMFSYRELVPTLESRIQVNDHLQLFNSQESSFLHTAYTSLILTKIGRIQTALDSAMSVRSDLELSIQNSSLSAADKAIKLRGLEEVDQVIQGARNSVLALQIDFRSDSARGSYTRQGYQSFQSDAEYSYLQLRQISEYLKEIARGLGL